MRKTMSTKLTTLLLLLTISVCSNQLIAQTTNGIFFQAVARDNFSNPAKDRKIYVQSSIIQTTPTGTKVLTEEHQANTDATGVFSISLGNGVRVGGTASSLTTIDWSKGPYYLNLKVAITPIGGNSNWDYNKEWVDMGTTSFGAVPFALYSASSAKVDDKLNVSDTTTMLKVYAKAIKVQSLETAVASKLTAADTLTMLAPYAKAAYTIDSSFFKAQLATKLSLTDTINYTKQKYTDSAIAKKLNIADSAVYVTKTQLARYNFSSGGNTTTTNVTMDTTSLSNRINLKADTTSLISLNTALTTEATTARAAELSLANNIASNTASITANATSISTETTRATSVELVLTNNITANTASITSNTASITSNAVAITAEATTARAAELALTNNIISNSASITANAAAITAEATTARAAELTLTNNITSNTASITSNAAAITAEATTARAAELILTNNIASSTSSITAINTILSEATSSNTANTLVKRDASGNLSAGSITASNYASTPITLSYSGSTINWNPTVGANAAITLTQNSTLSFSATPLVGSYGTVVLTQDGTGSRTITLPTIVGVTNKVLGSSSGTSIALSTSASAKDILNFYYDGTNCYWNIGQGYGADVVPSSTNLTTGVTGNLSVANGGTGASNQQAAINALTGSQSAGKYLRSDGTNASLTTIQVADVPALNQNTTGNAATATLAGNITATSNTTLTSLSNLTTVGTITSGTISLTTDIKTTSTITAGSVTYPNTHGTANQVLSTTGSGTLTWTTPFSGSSNTHSVGESYGGGVVFYTWDNGNHGLIVSTDDISTAKPAWPGNSNIERIKPLLQNNGLLEGKELTRTLVYYALTASGTGYPSSNIAAYLCYQYRGGDFLDWYLPSAYELDLLWQNRNVVANLASAWNSSTTKYWSSTLSYTDGGPNVQFYLINYLGQRNGNAAYDDQRVRAIRSF